MIIKTDCKWWEFEAKNECYMFKPFNCQECQKHDPKNHISIACIGPSGVGKNLLARVLTEKYIDNFKPRKENK